MREIKFRVWDGKDMLNIDHWTLSMINQHIPENHIIMQFTGLHDQKRTKEYPKGQPIYEGDIVEHKGAYNTDRGEVLWSRTELRFNCKLGCTILNGALSEFVEVIGDIHTTPELLEEKPNGNQTNKN